MNRETGGVAAPEPEPASAAASAATPVAQEGVAQTATSAQMQAQSK